jgi:hypothetical protein
MPNKARERWRRKEKEKDEGLDKKTIGGAKDLTPYNAVALMDARNSSGKVWAGYVIKLK